MYCVSCLLLSYNPLTCGSFLSEGEGTQTLISTSTPLGNSSFIKASIVLGVEL